ncbi:MAG: efflux RND transporter periplasmic adaptor subunit [Anaerolineales bacterium]|nr:efflux RND transporter periplasmic adaptor subunit [Anaerolineales bacterium]
MNKKTLLALTVIVVVIALSFVMTQQIAAKKAVETPATETAVVQRGNLSMTIDASGSIVPHMEIGLAFTSSGQVAELLVAEGEQVQAGQPLLRLDTQDLEWQAEQARLTVSIAEYDLSDARDDYWEEDEPVKKAKAKLEQAQVSLQQAKWRLEQATLVAPISGVVTQLFVDSGEMANTGQTVVVLSDLSNLDVEINLDETDVARVAMSTPIVITVDAFPGAKLSGEIIEIASLADVQSGVVLYPVTVRLNPTDSSTDSPFGDFAGQALPLRPGMTVNVILTIENREDTLFVPFRAVETEGGQAYVTRVTASGSERVGVTLGLVTDTQVEILSGIEGGDVVAVYANPVQDTAVMHSPIFGGGQ